MLMMRLLSAVAVTATLASAADNTLTPQEQREGFALLFDGVTTAGWHMLDLGASPGRWLARDGVLTYESGDSWLASDATYSDFVLRLEYRTAEQTDSGIFLRSTPAGYPSFTGMELEIKNDSGTPASVRSTSSLYGAVEPIVKTNRPAGEWNQVEVTVQGRHLAATWNGEKVQDVNLDDSAYANAQRGPLSGRAREGHVGFQAHLTGSPAAFKNIRIKRLAG